MIARILCVAAGAQAFGKWPAFFQARSPSPRLQDKSLRGELAFGQDGTARRLGEADVCPTITGTCEPRRRNPTEARFV